MFSFVADKSDSNNSSKPALRMSCTPAEIAEKRRIALERLKARKISQQTGAELQSKPAQTFYKKPETSNDGSQLLRVMHENKSSFGALRDVKNSAQSSFAKCSDKPNPEVSKIPAFSFTTVNCNCFMLTDGLFAVHPSSYLSKLIDVFKSIPSRSYSKVTLDCPEL